MHKKVKFNDDDDDDWVKTLNKPFGAERETLCSVSYSPVNLGVKQISVYKVTENKNFLNTPLEKSKQDLLRKLF